MIEKRFPAFAGRRFNVFFFTLLFTVACTAAARAEFASITLEQFGDMLSAGETFGLLDVRPRDEFIQVHFRDAVNIPHTEIKAHLDELRDKPWIIYCRTGSKANLAAQVLEQNGIQGFFLLEGGINAVPIFLKNTMKTNPGAAQAVQKRIVTASPILGFPMPEIKLRSGKESKVFPVPGRAAAFLFYTPGQEASETMLKQLSEFIAGVPGLELVTIVSDADQGKADVKAWTDPEGAAARLLGVKVTPQMILTDFRSVIRATANMDITTPLAEFAGKTVADLMRATAADEPMSFPDMGMYAEHKNPDALKNTFAADFTLNTLEGQTYSLNDYLGEKNVILVFFGLGCPYSRKQLEALNSYMATAGKTRDLVVLGVTGDMGTDYRNQIDLYIKNQNITYPILFDAASGPTFDTYMVEAVPTWMIVDKKGEIRQVIQGFVSDTAGAMEQCLNSCPDTNDTICCN